MYVLSERSGWPRRGDAGWRCQDVLVDRGGEVTALATRQGTTWAGPGVAGFPALAITALANSRLIAYEAPRFREVRDRIRHAQEVMVS